MLEKRLLKGAANSKQFFNIKERNSTGTLIAFVLTGYTITISIYSLNRVTNVVNDAAMTIENATTGQVSYTVQSAATTTVGRFLGRLKLVAGSETIFTPEFLWVVEDRA